MDATAGAFQTQSINRRDATNGGASAVLHIACGNATGSPSTQTVNGRLQDSGDGSTDWQNIGTAVTEMTGDDESSSSPNRNLVDVRKFVRAVVVIAFTGGSSPTIPVSATICFGGRE